MLKNPIREVAAVLAVALSGGASLAGPITYDEILFQETINQSLLQASVGMQYNGASVLTITIENTTPGSAWGGTSAAALLTGLGFNLPAGVSIASGAASIAGFTPVNFPTGFTGSDVSKEWGFNQGSITSGHFDGNGTPGFLGVNAVVSTMQTDAPFQFALGSIDNPVLTGDLSGPDFGLISSGLLAAGYSGLEASMNGVTLTLNLQGNVPGDLLSYIDSRPVVLTFGSPTYSSLPDPGSTTALTVPDGGATMALMGFGLTTLVSLRRRC